MKNIKLQVVRGNMHAGALTLVGARNLWVKLCTAGPYGDLVEMKTVVGTVAVPLRKSF